MLGELTNDLQDKLALKVAILETGVVRITIDENNPKQGGPRHQVREVLVGDVTHKIVRGDLSVSNGIAVYKSEIGRASCRERV